MWTVVPHNMCHEFDAFLNYKKYGNQQLVYLGDDSASYEIEGHGDVNIQLMNGMEKFIPDVLYVTDLPKSFFWQNNWTKRVEK